MNINPQPLIHLALNLGMTVTHREESIYFDFKVNGRVSFHFELHQDGSVVYEDLDDDENEAETFESIEKFLSWF